MVSLGSSTRSAARATFSAYRTVPIRWRLAGGSAVLTFIILASFAAVVGVLTDRVLTNQFVDGTSSVLQDLAGKMQPQGVSHGLVDCSLHVNLATWDTIDNPQIRLMDDAGDVLCTQATGLSSPQMQALAPHFTEPLSNGSYLQNGYSVAVQYIHWRPAGEGWLVYARPLSSLEHTLGDVRFFLLVGVLGGTVLALLAGLANAQRAMRPIVQLTEAAREIERTRDPSRHVPHPEAEDEIAELARTLEGMLGALDEARSATETALSRQREFVADASHELRTPLTSVLANLELLTDELTGEQAESARAALRSTRRMRRLVGDLLLLARADAQRAQPYRPTDLAQVLIDAAAEIEPLAEDHEITIEPLTAVVPGRRDDLHRMILNLLENAVRHTPAGTHIRARTFLAAGTPTVLVEDDGPGIPPELQRKVFERFVRGGGDGGRGSGLGLAIVQAVAESHGASVELGHVQGATGTRFVIRFTKPAGSPPNGDAIHTATTTGSTIGRRRSRS